MMLLSVKPQPELVIKLNGSIDIARSNYYEIE
jgi:hypothetical protein